MLASDRTGINLTSDTLAFLVAVIVVALTGGFLPAVITAVIASLLLNYYFTPPIHYWTIAQANNALALGVFVAVGLVTSWIVDTTARKSNQAARANAESELLRTTAGSILRGQGTLDALLERTREAFGMRSASLLERLDPAGGAGRGPAGEWAVVACSGDAPVTRPDDADVDVPVTDTLSLALAGRPLPADDRRVLGAFAAYAAVALEQQRLTAEAEAAKPIAAADRMRTALLAAVSHDLRSPIASAKAAVSVAALGGHRLGRRRQRPSCSPPPTSRSTGSPTWWATCSTCPGCRPARCRCSPGRPGLDEIVARSLDDLGPAGREITVDIPDTLPAVRADPAILERIVVNLTENALRYSPAGKPPLLAASALGDRVELRVVDRGPGIPEGDRDRMFVPFQRLGDTDNTTGVGLGLALARGLTEAMDGTLTAEDTPGGGLTMTISLPAAPGN